MTDNQLEGPNRTPGQAIASVEGQVDGLQFQVNLLTKRVEAAEKREFMYQIAGLAFAWFLLITVAIILVLNN